MKLTIWAWGLSVLCVIGAMGIVGCEKDNSDAPADISGSWSGSYQLGDEILVNETWVFNQNGESVTGWHSFDSERYTFSGTYKGGQFACVDDDEWTIRLNFDDDAADGTMSGGCEIWNVSLTRL